MNTKKRILLSFFVLLFGLTVSNSTRSQENEKRELMRTALEYSLYSNPLVAERFEEIMVRYPTDNTVVALSHYHLGLFYYVKGDYTKAIDHYSKVLDIELPKGMLKYTNLLLNPNGMGAANLKHNACSELASVYVADKNYRKALAYLDLSTSTYYYPLNYTSHPMLTAHTGQCFDANQYAKIYEALEKYDSAVFHLIPFCFGNQPENKMTVSYLKTILPKAFDTQQVKAEIENMTPTIEKNDDETIQAKVFGQSFCIPLYQPVNYLSKEEIIAIIVESDFYRFLMDSSN